MGSGRREMGIGKWGIGNGKLEMGNAKGENCRWELGNAKEEKAPRNMEMGGGRRTDRRGQKEEGRGNTERDV